MGKSLAILTCGEMPQMLPYDLDIIKLLNARGVKTDILIWDKLTNDDISLLIKYDLVLIRTIWDYYKKVDEFIRFLNRLESTGVNILNPLDIVKWNMDKKYLLQLQNEGFDIIPTLFAFNNEDIFDKAVEKGWKKMILKPMISAGSYHTIVVSANEREKFVEYRNSLFEDRPYMLQKFMDEIADGEISTLTLMNPSSKKNNGYSYSVTKVPKPGDYRVQFNYGGIYHLSEPDPRILDISNQITSRFGNQLLYKRLDGLWVNNRFMIMEIELIEPDLYLNLSSEALDTFVNSIVSVVG